MTEKVGSAVGLDERRVRGDLERVIRLQLEDQGVSSARIQSTGWCTREDARWFSHRGGRPGRFLAAVVAP